MNVFAVKVERGAPPPPLRRVRLDTNRDALIRGAPIARHAHGRAGTLR